MAARQYEAVVVLFPDLDDAAVQGEIAKIESLISAHEGAVTKKDIWGRRQLGFRMKKKEFGIYVVLVFHANTKAISDLNRQLRINEAVLRHLVVKKDQLAPDFVVRSERSERGPDDGQFGGGFGGGGFGGGWGGREGGFREGGRDGGREDRFRDDR